MDAQREPHSLSLKVLRLSRPSFAQQYPFAQQDGTVTIDPRAALSLPEGCIDDSFILSPLLTLPPAFGSAYVGEIFSCTLCVNNELSSSSDRAITSVKMAAEMQTPSQTVPLELLPTQDEASKSGLSYGQSLQKIVRFDLREEGNHVLVVSLSYSENIRSRSASSVSGGRVRSYRKLYQFLAQPCLSVRTKATELPSPSSGSVKHQASKLSRYALEAQLENLADGLITLEQLTFDAKSPFMSTSLNWDIPDLDPERAKPPTLAPREVTQVAFLVEETTIGTGGTAKELTKDGRVLLGVLTIKWRSAMGDPGILSTGWLTSRRI